ncbi:MAG: N-acetyltransferase [Pseudomonadales bacterium]|jgi:predicted N-acyltransferase|nr:N-acetyltransferase [Gammaproteobacteria bacterium]MBP6051368.1 N-acetyltransferase [Pseudomonadales bacterium]MBK6582859.1 N-acetyltransferase [Gammaproteobacteria bacterium]MBK7168248.1 N-acetyltransferase [Gammaproteobacteria bacterium]MBK7518988.1 N-acetyltransferase [Gammaproteobacteria bacterium]
MSQASFVSSVHALAREEWNALTGADFPFLRHEFLAALEDSASVGGASGWAAHHLVLHAGARLLAVMPCYLKTHSYGEYVFDWGWAEAYQRNGLDYYPKLLSAVPFTPTTGPRLLVASGVQPQSLIPAIVDSLRAELGRLRASSWHLLFPEPALADAFVARGLELRSGVQFHWINHGYRDFEDFLARLVSRKRKSLRRERRQVAEQGLTIEALRGGEVDAALWDRFYLFYQMTYARRSGHGGYLSREFFHRLGAAMPDRLLLVIARHGGEPVAGALNIIGHDTLYGRYWGCTEEFAHLHFETCYYQGIDFCIREGLQRFDAGAQGEHKLARGFIPVLTRSCHLIEHPGFRAAIHDFLERERAATDAYLLEAQLALPYRKQENSLPSVG